MKANTIGRPSEVVVEATITRSPTSKYLKPGDPLVQPQGEIAYWHRSPWKRLTHRLKKHFGKRGPTCK